MRRGDPRQFGCASTNPARSRHQGNPSGTPGAGEASEGLRWLRVLRRPPNPPLNPRGDAEQSPTGGVR